MSHLLEIADSRRWRVRDDGSRQGDASAEVLCLRGKMYPFLPAVGEPEMRFVAWTDRAIKIRRDLLAAPGARREQGSAEGSRSGTELAVSYPNESLDAVAMILRPRRMRPATVSPATIAAGLAALAARRARQGR